MNIYVDGELAGTAVHDYPLSHNGTADLFLGVSDHRSLPMASFLHGSMDEVRIYCRALGVKEIAALMKQTIAQGVLDTQDTDGDGISNAIERRAGTDSLNARDQLEIKSVACKTENFQSVVLQWASVPGMTYQILWAPNLMASFKPLVSGIVATGSECAYTNALNGAGTSFYMIQVQE